MQIIRYIILVLALWNMPSYLLVYFGSSFGSIASYLLSILLIGYFILSKKKYAPPLPFVLLTILYFTISGYNYSGVHDIDFFKELIRSMIVVVFSAQVIYNTTNKEIYFFLLIGALSIIINASIFPTANGSFAANYGRYSGFYLNPNAAGAICIGGYALVFTIKNVKTRILGQLIFTLGGILTFSRTFIAIWLIISAVSILNDRKNLIGPAVGALSILIVFSVSTFLSLNTERFNALQSIFDSQEEVQVKTIEKDSRTETWALYTNVILEKPFFGHGYQKLQGNHFGHRPGVHNAYLMILGESGFIPFLIFIGIYLYVIRRSLAHIRENPTFFYLSCTIALFLLTGHGYYDNYYNLFMTMYVYLNIQKLDKLNP
ncbi:O-antigen ligase family protein [Zobellia russellii]|uniref:O-antigen ligase family protein n=1 Tax=Zobellia russellii TaxID=248907 RepID=UPI001BFF6D23|nr:O-antigen ligase family protein [Zobellia russellii]MBT9189030.1 O-antigen ligase family protein [Zobellia russellii]